ncbi:unnamed protein product [Meloidogyne enterolobii]|uniref:Uncharacterized protein n=2 Tax=Meloidogyne enterolobii TaxID=390850 RepID=A0ACB1AKE1_MELEN
MLELLAQINASMEQLKLLDYSGALNLGSLRLRTEFTVSIFYKSKSAGAKGVNSGKKKGEQEMQLLLFDGGILLCKERLQTTTQQGCKYFEHKFCIPKESLGFAASSRFSNQKFEIWDTDKNGNSASYCFAMHPLDEEVRALWIRKLSKSIALKQ